MVSVKLRKAIMLAAVLLALAAGGVWAGMQASKFDTAYAKWNAHYKQALYLTSKNDHRTAVREMILMRRAWDTLLMYGYDEPPAPFRTDAKWQQDLATMTGYLQIAHTQLLGAKLEKAHATLEHVRQLWTDIRTRNKVGTFGDVLVRYHDVLEPTVLWATGKAKGGVTAANATDFEKQTAALAAAWQKVTVSPRPALSTEERKQLDTLLAQETEAIGKLQATARTKQSSNISSAAANVKDVFSKIYLQFG